MPKYFCVVALLAMMTFSAARVYAQDHGAHGDAKSADEKTPRPDKGSAMGGMMGHGEMGMMGHEHMEKMGGGGMGMMMMHNPRLAGMMMQMRGEMMRIRGEAMMKEADVLKRYGEKLQKEGTAPAAPKAREK